MLRTPDAGQFSYFTARPGITRGGHYHHSKTEKFLVLHGAARFGFRHILTDQTYELVTTAEEARNHESRNVITRALGTKASEEIGGWPAAFDARPGDRLLLCSDGVHDPLEDQELLCLMAGKGPDQAAAALIAGANARGGHDNASAVVVDFLDAAPKTPKATRILQTLRGARS